MFYQGMYEHSYASIPNRGAHKGKKQIEKWIKYDPKNCKYVFKGDIHHFFPSINHDILKAKLAKKIKDEQFLDLVYKVIDTTKTGLPIGFYTSQWFSNWYLMEFDHFVKEQLHSLLIHKNHNTLQETVQQTAHIHFMVFYVIFWMLV